MFDTTANACYLFRNSAVARAVFIMLMLAAVGTAVFARPKQLENLTVKNYALRDISVSTADQYVRVSGMFKPDEAYKRYLRLNSIFGQGFGSKFIALADPSSGATIWVLDENLPELEQNAAATFVGRIELGAGELPPIYLAVGDPPNVRLANFLARVGIGVMGAGVAFLALLVVVHRAQYALPALWQRAPAVNDAPPLLWFGELGRQYDDVVLRCAPANFVAGIHEGKIESARVPGQWSVSVRRLRKAVMFDLATAQGPLPAVRLRFEDERGLWRTGVIATNSTAARDALMTMLGLIRA